MKILFEANHPAHVHFFKNAIRNLEDRGHEVLIEARDKDVTFALLDTYKLNYKVVGPHYKSLVKKAYGLVKTDFKLLKIGREFKPDVLIGRGSVYLAHLSVLINKPYIAFVDTEHAKLMAWLTLPFTDAILTPSCFKKKINPKKHIKFDGYKELAYLHPNYFKPDSSVLDDLELSRNDNFIVLRFVSWRASHDVGERGFDIETKMQFIKKLENYSRIFITSETELGREFEKYKINIPIEKIHSLLYYATMYIGESPTMTTESAILGTPAICVSSWACSCGNFEDLYNNYGLIYCFKNQNNAITFALDLLEDNNLKKKWKRKREKLLNDKIDVTKFMTDFIERYPESYHEYIKREG
jgi:predicted glycosyltransferase